MKIVLSAGPNTQQIVDLIHQKFDSSGDELIVIPYIEDISYMFNTGDYFDKAIIVEQSITKSGEETEEYSIRAKLNQFVCDCKTRYNNEKYVFLTGNEDIAMMIYEETMDISDKSTIVFKTGKYGVKFFAKLITLDSEQLPEDWIYVPKEAEIENNSVFVTEDDPAPFYNTDVDFDPIDTPSDTYDVLDESNEDMNEQHGSDTNTFDNTFDDGNTFDNTFDDGNTFDNTFDDGNTFGNTFDDGNTFGNTFDDGNTFGNTFDDGNTFGNTFDDGNTFGNTFDDGNTFGNTFDDGNTFGNTFDDGNTFGNTFDNNFNDENESFGDNNDAFDENTLMGDNELDSSFNNDFDNTFDENEPNSFNDKSNNFSTNEFDDAQGQYDNTQNLMNDTIGAGVIGAGAILMGNMQGENNMNQQGTWGGTPSQDYDNYDEQGYGPQDYDPQGYGPQDYDNQGFSGVTTPIIDSDDYIDTSDNNNQFNHTNNMNQQPEQHRGSRLFGNNNKDQLKAFAARGNNICVTGCGGCGTSTVAFNIANVLANFGYNVLLVDFDTETRTQNYLSRNSYNSMDPTGSNLMAAVNSSQSIKHQATIIKPGFHLLTMGIGGETAKPEELLNEQKISRFINLVKSMYNFVIYDVPFDSAVGFLSETVYLSDNLVVVTEMSTHGIIKTMLKICNIDSQDMQDTFFSKAQLVFNRNRNLNKLLGKKIKTAQDITRVMDEKVLELVGQDMGLYFSEMQIAGILNDDPDYELAWFETVQYSDTNKGKQIYKGLVDNIILNR